ncbi:ImmA/IrrE family metallo-endopeptidase [Mycobacterium hackensackense]|nr:ImmA/IrrE family metallo-endopeptidase [Mycobacterium hackensackense]
MSSYVADPAWLTNDAISQYAERVGVGHDIYDASGRADIDVLLRRLGGDVRSAIDEESLHVRGRGNFTVFIPHFTSSRRDRFTIAHELGHYFLHYLYPKEVEDKKFGRGGRDRAETEANVFASALLMPAEKFADAYRELGGDPWRLASRFDVSPRAATVRAEVLGLR